MRPDLFPIDVHIHGIGECDTRTGLPEDMRSIARMEGEEGVRGVLLSLYPSPVPVMRQCLLAAREAMRGQGKQGREDFPAARILGVHLEGPFLNPLRCGALDPGTFLAPSWYAYRQISEGFEDIIRVVTVAPELDGAPDLISRLVRSGAVVSMGHSDATYREAEAGFKAGASGVVHIFNAMRPFAHREPGISGFALTNRDIYVEIIADPHHLHLETIRLVFNTKPADRILIVSDSVRGVPSQALPEGGIVSGAEKRAALTQDGRLRGGSMGVVAASARLIEAGFDKRKVIQAITGNPARYLGLS